MLPTIDAFQFNASPRTPRALHTTLMEVIHFCNHSFRNFYGRAADATLRHAVRRGMKRVVELGAGEGPITRALAADPRADQLTFVVCDLIPQRDAFAQLEAAFPGRVTAIHEPVDFSQPRDWGPDTMLVLCASFHHVPCEERAAAFANLVSSSGCVFCFSPVRKTQWCMLSAVLAVIPAILLPLGLPRWPGIGRRILWCWIVPVVPLMMLWDGVGGCLRQWSAAEWRQAHRAQGLARPLEVVETLNSQAVVC